MNALTDKMRSLGRDLLAKGEVQRLIGWEKGSLWYHSPPVFVERPEDAEKLVWDEFCVNNLSKYLLDERAKEGKTGLFVKGCDSRGVNRLIQDQQIKRDQVYLIGIACPGVKDPAQAANLPADKRGELPLAGKCAGCTHPEPVVYDALLNDLADARPGDAPAARFQAVADLAQLAPDERYAYWARQFDRCIRCYACRNVCPVCSCRECIFDRSQSGWVGKRMNMSENAFYGLTKIWHMAARCVECGECERVCPVGIPVMTLNKKLIQDIDANFGPYEAGVDPAADPPLGAYRTDDPDFS